MAILDTIRRVLATRVLMLLALCGAFWLANRAIDATDAKALYVLIAYCCLTILPLVFIELAARSKGR